MNVTKFSPETIAEIGYYVYIYSDPDTRIPFYVGKGKGNRVFSHLHDTSESEKVAKIQSLKDNDKEPLIEILVHGLKDEITALKVEAAVIDLIGKRTLLIYQEIIKSPCVIRFHDNASEVYSFALKRLSQNDKTQIVVTDKLLTSIFPVVMPSTEKMNFLKELSVDNIKNQTNKVSFYVEMYIRAYILTNDKVYANAKSFLVKPIWYSENKVLEIYNLLLDVAKTKEKVQKATTNSEKMQLNQEIRKLISELDRV